MFGARPDEPDPAEYKALFGKGTQVSAGAPLTDDELFGKEGSR